MFHAQPAADFLEATGEDHVDFLHGLLSNDVRGLQPGSGNRSLLLSHRGHALAGMTVLRLPGRILLAVEDGQRAFVSEELERHRIFDQVELGEPAADTVLVTVQGSDLTAAREALAGSGQLLGEAPAPRSAPGGSDFIVALPGEAVDAVLRDAGSRPLSLEQLELERVRAGLPSVLADGGAGVLPQEAGLEPLVSYRKGCYLGQEIMARIEARGNLRRGLRKVLLDGEPADGAERDVTAEGRRVGRLGSVAREDDGSFIGLAVLRLDLPEDAVLEAAGTKLTVLP